MACQSDHGGLTEEVRNLGRKARARRDELAKNRREIQRVDDDEAVVANGAQQQLITKKSGPSVVQMELLTAPKRSTKDHPKKTSLRKRPPRSVNREVEDKNVDRWMPSTDQLLVAAQQRDNDESPSTCPSPSVQSTTSRSSVVQLHGLPRGVTTGQIRKFFSGLRIHRLIVLPRHNYTVPELDASSTIPMRKPGLCIERYNAIALRLLLKFESTPAAVMAVQRSGEVMPCNKTLGLDTDDTKTVVVGAAVRLTIVPKLYATTLLAILAIDCPMNYALPIEQFLKTLDRDLDAIVPAILWTEAIQRLNLRTTRPALPTNVTYPIFPRRKKVSFQLSSDQVAVLSERRDELQKVLSQLRYKLPFPSADVMDPTIADPALTLHTTCAKLLQDEIDRADRHALISSKWKALILARPQPCGNGAVLH